MAADLPFASPNIFLANTSSSPTDINHPTYPSTLPDSSQERTAHAKLHRYLASIKQELERPLDRTNLLRASARLAKEIKAHCAQPNTTATFPSSTRVRIANSQATTGEFVCLEVGGSTLRCAIVDLQHTPDTDEVANKTTLKTLETQAWNITEKVKLLPGSDFFGWIARNVASWMGSLQVEETKTQAACWRLCLTWSFPFRKTATNQASIVRCGKGFRVFDDLVRYDIGTLLVEAFQEEGVCLTFESIVNDTVGGLLRGRLDDPDMRISMVLGTGLNAAITLPVATLDPSRPDKDTRECGLQKTDHVFINTELSLLGVDVVQRTRWDDALIQNLPAGVCKQPLEYMCGGYYIGELVRIIFVSTICYFPSWAGRVPERLFLPDSLASSLVSTLVGDTTADLSVSAAEFSEAFESSVRESAPWLDVLRCIALSVCHRASGVMAMSIFALYLVAYGDDSTTPQDGSERVVGVSGAVFEKLPGFKESCEKMLNHLIQGLDAEITPATPCTLRLISGGSLTGCALAVGPHP
ncbi:hypothetical protein M409DRAFT_17778 [Zasmidium cellare ATCC 36951]|uniref:Phosphotransferase n=1 Tax=Zasmidium cellare ATCC 36951 TaxID=1080233 RepID=A0A6A6D2A3_ZASCE|nr:uncharacterized protein M409DRAFT_17778 [Zasmidium cellare ATCC 36951]KAF2172548.1 hypothetical protein M409DRAFT_17778 [Zasmidium cellare ATCC 36951]